MPTFIPGIPVRRLHAFYEQGGPYGLDELFAQRIYGAALTILARYTGTIVLNEFRGMQLPGDAPLQIGDVNFASDHTALITKRPVLGTISKEVDGVHSTITNTLTHEIIASKLLVTVRKPTEDTTGAHTIGTIIHEMGHTFGLEHCSTSDCLMETESRLMSGIDARLLGKSAPFCGNCAIQLEIAGRRALAQEIG